MKRILILLIILLGCSKSKDIESPEKFIAIVIKEEVVCKIEINQSKNVDRKFRFGDIIQVSLSDKRSDLVQITDFSCFVEKKDLFIDEEFTQILTPQNLVCNVFTEVSQGAKIYISKKIFYSMEVWPGWAGYLEYNGKQYEQPLLIKVGKIIESESELKLFPEFVGVQENSGNFIGILAKNEFQSEYRIQKLINQKDNDGKQFLAVEKFDKSKLTEYCQFNDKSTYETNKKQVYKLYWQMLKPTIRYPYFPVRCRYLQTVVDCLL